ncbi:MAG: diversity-generating retroelement protein Avd [Chloroflexi bacterium]|nr:diversity-generating retroelement protein Avd [Chloroflexota bacterium]
MTESPIFAKTYDFILWLLPHTRKFPKEQRFSMAQRLEDTAFAFQDLILRAAKTKSPRRFLVEADIELDKLRFQIRLCLDLNLLSPKQYEFAATQIVEIGKLLGGWLKKTTATSTSA